MKILFLFFLIIINGFQLNLRCLGNTNNNCKLINNSSHCSQNSKETKENESKELNNLCCCSGFVFVEDIKPYEISFDSYEVLNMPILFKDIKLIKNFNSTYFHPPEIV